MIILLLLKRRVSDLAVSQLFKHKLKYKSVELKYKLCKETLQGICDYTNQQYVAALEDYLKRVRLLYEQGKIDEEEYKKLEADLTKRIKTFRVQQYKPASRQINMRL
jgi:hypothetical protein